MVVPRISKNLKDGRAFSYRAQILWNTLPKFIRESDTVGIFKSRSEPSRSNWEESLRQIQDMDSLDGLHLPTGLGTPRATPAGVDIVFFHRMSFEGS